MHNNKSQMELANNIRDLGITLMNNGKLREAALLFEKSLLIVPDYQDAALCLAHCLHQQGKYVETLALYEQLTATNPVPAVIWNNRGTTLLAMCRYEEAAASYCRAVELMPEAHDTQVALATCYQALGSVTEAETICDKVIAAAPENAEAHWNRALLLLLKGDYREGWREYEWRWQKRNFTSPRRSFYQPLWQGEPITGKTILIHAEQGFGDTLQFSRYLPMLAAVDVKVIFECHHPLVSLMKSLDSRITVLAQGSQLPAFDLHLPLLSLPLVFDTTLENIPADIPYVKSLAADFKSSLLSATETFKVGICWAGKAYPDPMRSCPEELLAPLTEVEGISWYSLQIGWDKPLPFQMADLTGHVRDFNDTAALISQLDLVISIDTAVAHLAGALGKPTWITLPYAPDWRWLIDRGDSPWYPTVRLLRQKETGAWGDLIQLVANLLEIETALFRQISAKSG